MADHSSPSSNSSEAAAAEATPLQEPQLARWIDLNDPSGAKLKLATIDVGGQPVRHLFVTNMAWSNPKWHRCIRELKFVEAPSRRYLVRRITDADRVSLRQYTQIFPQARVKEMSPTEYILGYGKSSAATSDNRQARIDLQGAKRLGRNADGYVVYEGVSGRFALDEEAYRRVDEVAGQPSPAFLRLADKQKLLKPGTLELHEALAPAAVGLVRGMQRGEPMHAEHIRVLIEALFGEDSLGQEAYPAYEAAIFDAMHEALMLQVRQSHETPASAYLEAARLHAYQPAFAETRLNHALVPLPLAMAAQQMLGDVKDRVVVLPNRWDGALASFMDGAQVRAWQAQPYAGPRASEASLASLDDDGQGRLALQPGVYSPLECASADALMLNVDPVVDELGQRLDLRMASQSLRQLKRGARAVLLLPSDDVAHPGVIGEASKDFMNDIFQRYVIDDAWEVAPILLRKTGEGTGIRMIAVRAQPPEGDQIDRQLSILRASRLPVMASWDAIKTHVDERIQSLNLGETVEREERAEDEDQGVYQRPYLAFSRLGEARTMVPANMQAPMQQYLTSLESRVGSVDAFVSEQLGMGRASLMKRFSPEQIDGVAIMLSRLLVGRSSILADDTGIGKGRQLAALAVWANKSGKDVVFVTDRANLFSDLARDLNDIGEWGRFAPLVFNADGEITVDAGPDQPPRVLAKGESPAVLNRIIEDDVSLREAGRNICFLTYSQINTEESEKARWLKNQVKDALVIFDEAHICAGSDSNMAAHASEIASAAAAVQFASATWAKTPDNLHVYQRAFPSTVSTATLAETMRKGGETFSEIFSGMLALEGALIRREHDLSRLEVELLVDEDNRQRNERVSDLVADALGAAAYLAGEMEQVFIRTNADSVRALRQAREARNSVLPPRVKLFSSNFGAGSVVYQVMKGVQGSLNADHVARLAIESLRKGMKPVIVSDATGESLLEKLLLEQRPQDNAQVDDADGAGRLMRMPSLRDLLRDVLVKRLTTMRVREVDSAEFLEEETAPAETATDATPDATPDAAGATVNMAVAAGDQADAVAETEQSSGQVPAAGGEAAADQEDEVELQDALEAASVPTRARKAMRKASWKEISIFDADNMSDDLRAIYERGIAEIETKIAAIPDMALNAMDVIEQAIRDEGYRIGEITGRKNQLMRVDDAQGSGEGLWRLQPRVTNKRAVKASIKAFNDGSLDALLINRSAAAGVSLHASPRFADRSRRHLIEHMIPEDPVNRVQLLGRVNRYDQVSSPLITTASTGIYGEVRYLMMQNRKLARMSANVRSSRDNAMSLKGVVDLFNSVGSRAVRSYMQDNPLVCKRLGFDPDDIERMPDVVNRVTMRIPLLTVAQQKQVYEEIYSRFDEILLREEMEGSNPLKPAEFDVKAKLVSQTLFVGDDGAEEEETAAFASAFDSPVWAQRLSWEETLKPLSWEAVRAAAEASRARLLNEGLVVVDEDDGRVSADAEEFLAVPDEDEFEGDVQTAGDLLAMLERSLRRGRTTVSRSISSMSMPKLPPEMVSAMLRGFEGMKRLMQLQPQGDDSFDESRAASDSPAFRRALFVHEWMRRNLERLVPGASVSWVAKDESDGNMLRPDYVITDVHIPPRDQWMHLGKWKITMAAGGNERGREFSLRSLVSEVDGAVFQGEVTGRTQTTLFGPVLRDGIYGAPARRLSENFNMAPSGKRRRGATMLGGNLYLASEWAAATGKGRSVIYTDESGARHRGILLPQDLENVRSEFLPVRLADAASQRRLLQAIFYPQAHGWISEDHRSRLEELAFHTLDLSFKSAMARSRSVGGYVGESAATLVLVPGVGIGVSMSSTDLRRVSGSLKAAQKALEDKEKEATRRARADQAVTHVVPADDARGEADQGASVRIVQHRSRKSLPAQFAHGLSGESRLRTSEDATGSRKAVKSSLLVLYAQTPAQVDRALHLLSNFAGLEIYAARTPYRAMAQEAIRMTMRERRQELARAQEALLSGRRQADDAVQAPSFRADTQATQPPQDATHDGAHADDQSADDLSDAHPAEPSQAPA